MISRISSGRWSILGQQGQVAFRSFHQHQHRISAQSGSTAYGSMRSDSMNIESALFLPSNHSSLVSSSFCTTPSEFRSSLDLSCSASEHISLRIRLLSIERSDQVEVESCISHSPIYSRRYDTRSTHALAVPPLPSAPVCLKISISSQIMKFDLWIESCQWRSTSDLAGHDLLG